MGFIVLEEEKVSSDPLPPPNPHHHRSSVSRILVLLCLALCVPWEESTLKFAVPRHLCALASHWVW